MKNVSAVVAVNSNWGIGNNNQLLYHIKEDMKRFKKLTENNVVIMGRKTFDSLPNRTPLSNRINVVITTDKHKQFTKKDFPEINAKLYYLPMYEVKKLLKRCKNKNIKEEIFVIGGQSIYEQLLQFCNNVYVTKIDDDKKADTFFPNLDLDNIWNEYATSCNTDLEKKLSFKFCIYSKEKERNNDCINW